MAETYHEDHKMNKHYLRMFTHKSQMGFEKKFFKDFSLYIPIYPPLKPKHTPKEQYLKKKTLQSTKHENASAQEKQVKDFQAYCCKKKTPFFLFIPM